MAKKHHCKNPLNIKYFKNAIIECKEIDGGYYWVNFNEGKESCQVLFCPFCGKQSPATKIN